MQLAALIIWDDIMASLGDQVDFVDYSLWDIIKIDEPFVGNVMDFEVDPHQIFDYLTQQMS